MRVWPVVAIVVVLGAGIVCWRGTRPGGGEADVVPPLGAERCGGKCGTERWLVKTLSDADRDRVHLSPVDATVEELVALTRPRRLPANGRFEPVETTVYRVEGYWGAYDAVRRENDGDLHLVIFGLTNQRLSLIAEIPNPECAGACRSGLGARYAHARAAIEERLAHPTADDKADKPIRIRLTGVGFFDHPHGQVGAAANNVELHPVLTVEFP